MFCPPRFLAVLACLVLLAALPSPGAAGTAGLDVAYQAAATDFAGLRNDPNSVNRRDLWQALAARFEALAGKAGRTALGAKALYYQAWVNAELAVRSRLPADAETAVALYRRVAENFPKNSWADDALLRRATLLADPLKRPAEARADLETILRRHPAGDMAGRARAMLADLGAASKTAHSPDASGKTPPGKSDGPPAATAARPATLVRVGLEQNKTGAQLVLTLDRETAYRYQILDQKRSTGDPVKRLYIDLDNTRIGSNVPTEKLFDKSPVSRLRAGYFSPDTVRVVLEIDDVRQHEIRSETGPFRVILDVAGAARAKAAQEFRGKAVSPGRAEASHPEKEKETKAAAAPAREEASLRPTPDAKKRAGSLIQQLGLGVETIMIDPGHGGKDPGAQAQGLTEKDVNLRFARVLGEALREKGFKVLYTRSSDVFIPLETRTEMANSKGADLFVSIHCNAHGNTSSSGLETYSLNLATTRDAVRVAARENASSQKNISDLQAILTDLMLSAKTSESKDLARLVQKRTLSGLRGAYRTRDRGPHEAPFFVLIGANMPAVLVELGYITNPDEARRLSSDAYMKALAQGMVDGIVAYKKRIERYANL